MQERPTILYVDDEEPNLFIFAGLFERHYEVITSSSSIEALALIESRPITVILADQRMPEMTGVEFLEQALVLAPDAVRILLTAYSDIEAVIAAINSGQVYRYIAKPWNNHDLKMTIDSAVHVHQLQRENKELLKHLSEHNQLLEQKVEHRTRELDEKNKENERLMQRELTLMALQLAQKNELLEALENRLKQVIQSTTSVLDDIAKEIHSSITDEKAWEPFEKQFYNANPEFLQRLYNLCPTLTPMEIKVCTLLKINLSTKEIAHILSVSSDAVEFHRLNVRKKFDIPRSQNLTSFLSHL